MPISSQELHEGTTHPMRFGKRLIRRRSFIWYTVLGLAVAAVATLGLESIYGTSSASTSTARTVTVQRGTVQSSVSASGNVSAATSDSVSFQTSGTLTAVDVTLGQKVTAGQTLGTLDPTSAQATLASAQAALSVAQYALSSAEQGGTTAQLDQNKASLISAQNQLTSEQQQLATDETNLTKAQNQLTADQALGCPAASSSASSSSSGAGSSGGGSAQTSTSGTGSATSASDTAVTFSGTVNPGGVDTTYYFMYGTTVAYSSSTPSADAGSGTTSVQVSATVTGLTPDTTYLYRLVTVNSTGTSVGVAQTVSTAASACVVDQDTIASDQQTVAKDKATVAAQQYTVAGTSAGQAVTSSTIAQDQAQVTQDQNTVTADQKAVNDTVLTAPVSGIVTSVNNVVGDTVTGSGSSSSGSWIVLHGVDVELYRQYRFGRHWIERNGFHRLGRNRFHRRPPVLPVVVHRFYRTRPARLPSSPFRTSALSRWSPGLLKPTSPRWLLGETATATLPALPNTTVTGTVVAVSPTSTVTSNVVTYDVTIALQSPPSSVKVGMTADVSVVVQTATNTLEVAECGHHHHRAHLHRHRPRQRQTDGHHRHDGPGGRLHHPDPERVERWSGRGRTRRLGVRIEYKRLEHHRWRWIRAPGRLRRWRARRWRMTFTVTDRFRHAHRRRTPSTGYRHAQCRQAIPDGRHRGPRPSWRLARDRSG